MLDADRDAEYRERWKETENAVYRERWMHGTLHGCKQKCCMQTDGMLTQPLSAKDLVAGIYGEC
jgi:hypothetical protein